MGGRDNALWQVQFASQERQTFVGEDVVVVLPAEGRLDVAFAVQGLHRLDDLQVGHLKVLVFGRIEVLLRDKDAVLEERFVDQFPVLLRDKHGGSTVASQKKKEATRSSLFSSFSLIVGPPQAAHTSMIAQPKAEPKTKRFGR